MFNFLFQAYISLYGIGVDDTSIEKSDYGTVLTLARRYVDLIRKIQPSGPFYLGMEILLYHTENKMHSLLSYRDFLC